MIFQRYIVITLVYLFADAPSLEPLGRLDDPALREVSGLVQSRRRPGIFWVHNDSGNPPLLYAVRRDGALVQRFPIKALNVDWEDVATDDEGHLYIGDIGNNEGRLPIRAIYRIDEPDPDKAPDAALRVAAAWFYEFPANGRFDAEGLFIDGGRAVVVAKYRDGHEAELFAVRLDRPAPLTRPILPELIGKLPGFTEPATGADLAPGGRLLAVCSYAVARVYERADGVGWQLVGTVRYEADGIEAIAWDGRDLILAGEGRGMYRIKEAAWRAGRP